MKKLTFILIVPFLLFSSLAIAKPSWKNWINQLRQEAISDGIAPRLFDHIFSHMTPSPSHIQLDRNQPEKRITYYKYRNTRGDAYRIKIGRREFRKHRQLLMHVSKDFGVDPCVITALWGLESAYGKFMGNFNVIRSLATLAYDSRRGEFFRKQLFFALHMLNDGVIRYEDFKGEWAGASGQCQFLPSSFNHYAVDYDHDGRKNIWKSYPDIFASIANYLKQNGWESQQLVLTPVHLTAHFDKNLMGLKITKTFREWTQLGVRPSTNRYIDPNTPASILQPEGGPTWMVFQNFKTLMSWNRSIYYAGTVNYVAKGICRGI